MCNTSRRTFCLTGGRLVLPERADQLVREERKQRDVSDRPQLIEGAKVGILPVKFPGPGPVHAGQPSVFGQRWNIQVAITPVIPKLIKENILEGW